MAIKRVRAWRCPPDKRPTGCFMRSSSPIWSRARRSRNRALSLLEIRAKGALPLVERRYASARFSSIVMPGAVPFKGSWNRRPIMRLRWYSGRKVRFVPSSRSEPSST